MNNTLHLIIKKQWFDLILSGEKTEEYRDIKPYWTKRFYSKKYHYICFRNGYASNSPQFTIELKSITPSIGRPEWGAEEGKTYFVLSLGKIINQKYIKDEKQNNNN